MTDAIAPKCGECGTIARLTTGRAIYRNRPDLYAKPIWICDDLCGAYVTCHPGTNVPLGTPARAELRRARQVLHKNMIDALWKTAHLSGAYVDVSNPKRIQRHARVRVYEFLADRLGIEREACHVGLFDLETCRRAWRSLNGVTYLEVRAWAKGRRAA